MSNAVFTLTAHPGTDIWRKPPTTNIFRAPTRFSSPAIPLSSFRRARISFRAAWTHRYDQGGLLLCLNKPSQSRPDEAGKWAAETAPKWLKTGVEFYGGKPLVSTVGCDRWADWSVYPVTAVNDVRPANQGEKQSLREGDIGEITVEVARQPDALGTGLWVYQVVLDETGKEKERIPVREVTWFFAPGENVGDEGWEIMVGAMAARPAKAEDVGGDEGLVVRFSGLEVEVNGKGWKDRGLGKAEALFSMFGDGIASHAQASNSAAFMQSSKKEPRQS